MIAILATIPSLAAIVLCIVLIDRLEKRKNAPAARAMFFDERGKYLGQQRFSVDDPMQTIDE